MTLLALLGLLGDALGLPASFAPSYLGTCRADYAMLRRGCVDGMFGIDEELSMSRWPPGLQNSRTRL